MYSVILQTIFNKYQDKNNKIDTSLVSRDFGSTGTIKLILIIIFHFNIRGKLSKIRCYSILYYFRGDKYADLKIEAKSGDVLTKIDFKNL